MQKNPAFVGIVPIRSDRSAENGSSSRSDHLNCMKGTSIFVRNRMRSPSFVMRTAFSFIAERAMRPSFVFKFGRTIHESSCSSRSCSSVPDVATPPSRSTKNCLSRSIFAALTSFLSAALRSFELGPTINSLTACRETRASRPSTSASSFSSPPFSISLNPQARDGAHRDF
jgi:hypothetical protein